MFTSFRTTIFPGRRNLFASNIFLNKVGFIINHNSFTSLFLILVIFFQLCTGALQQQKRTVPPPARLTPQVLQPLNIYRPPRAAPLPRPSASPWVVSPWQSTACFRQIPPRLHDVTCRESRETTENGRPRHEWLFPEDATPCGRWERRRLMTSL